MQRRSLSAIFVTSVLIILISTTAACGSSSNNGPKALRIIAIPKSLASNYWTIVENGIKCSASKVPNVNIVWNGVASDIQVSDQIAILQNYLSQSPDGILYAATDATALAPISRAALASNIPIYNFDSGTSPQSIPLFATDNTTAAAQAADHMGALLNGTGKIAILEFVPGSAANDQRVNGFKNELAAKYPHIQIVSDQADNNDAATALNVTQNILTAHPDLNGIYAASQQGGEGVGQALSSAKLGRKIHVISFDASAPLIADLQSGVADVLVVQNPFKMGYDSLNAMVDQIRDGKIAANEDTGVTFVTKANFYDAATQAVLNPSCANPPV